MTDNIKKKYKSDTIDLNYFIDLFVENWWIFGICIFVALAITYSINKYSPRVYKAMTSLIINEDNKSFSEAPAQLMQDFGFISSSKKFINELQIIKSSPVIKTAIDELDFRISYFQKNKFIDNEMYKSSPFVVIIDPEHPQPVHCKIHLQFIDNNSYLLSILEDDVEIHSFISNQNIQSYPELNVKIKGTFEKIIQTQIFNFKILLNQKHNLQELKENDYWFVIHSDKNLIREYQNRIEIESADIEATIAKITIETTVPDKTIDFLNSLTKAYLNKDLIKKRITYDKTIEYINTQLSKVSESLDNAEDNLEQFRSTKQVLDISMQAQQIFDELNQLKNEKARLTVNLKYVDYIQEYFKNNTQFSDLITPAAMGIEDPTLNSLIEELIRLNAEKASFIENNQEKSPYLQKINIRINNLRNMIGENINYIKRTTNIALEDVDSRINQLNSQIRQMPQTERELLGIERIFNINNNIYTYLLQKKSEAEISKASYQSNAEIIEPADLVSSVPFKPNQRNNYIIALLLGILLPLSTIRIIKSLSKTFHSEEEVEANVDIPILGRVYSNHKKIEDVVDGFPNSHIAESFRLMNVNLNYFLSNSGSKVITFTSTISGEGKSFISLNLAHILANNNFKTILVGFDIRRPKKYVSLNAFTNVGISEFLSYQANLDDIIQKTSKENLDIIFAGNVPPNPAELIATNKTDELLNLLRENYDYIIIDTPPVGIVTDPYVLMVKSNLNIFVTRIKHTPKKEFVQLMHEIKDKKLINSIVINDMPVRRKTKYGYEYYAN